MFWEHEGRVRFSAPRHEVRFTLKVSFTSNMKENQFENITKKSILEDLESQVLLARKLGNVYEQRPDLDEFVGAMEATDHAREYTSEAVAHDKAYVDTIRGKIDEKNSSHGRENLDNKEIGFQLSEMLQAMIVDRMNNHWFKNCTAIMTSDYDDLRSGIDAVLKHEKGGYLGAAFDFTITNKDKIIYEKLNKDWERNISRGSVPVLKYYKDPHTGEKKRLLVPKFIIGGSKQDVEELAQAYLENNQEVLDNHPFKYLMLLQIEEQLQASLDFYETNKDPKLRFSKDQYEKIQKLIREMKRDIHMDENMNVDLHEYAKNSVALDMMRRFRIMRERDLMKEETGS